jgi:excisionase family DNA binding protein
VSEPGPVQPPIDPGPAGDDTLLSVREAAQIKGVSYSATLRAVRSGRLPATRVGRIALIARGDLGRWQPGRSVPSPAVTSGPVDVPTPGLAARLADVMGRPGTHRLAGLLSLLAETLDAGEVTLRLVGTDGDTLTPRAWTGDDEPAELALSDVTDWPGGLRAGPAPEGALAGTWLAPVRVERRLAALVSARLASLRASVPAPTAEQAALLVSCVAATLADERRAAIDAGRVAFFRSLVAPDVEAASATASGVLRDATPAFLRRFGLDAVPAGTSVDLVDLLAVYESVDERGGAKRSAARRLREALVDGETVTLPWTRLPTDREPGSPPLRVSVAPLGEDGAGTDPLAVIRLAREPGGADEAVGSV